MLEDLSDERQYFIYIAQTRRQENPDFFPFYIFGWQTFQAGQRAATDNLNKTPGTPHRLPHHFLHQFLGIERQLRLIPCRIQIRYQRRPKETRRDYGP